MNESVPGIKNSYRAYNVPSVKRVINRVKPFPRGPVVCYDLVTVLGSSPESVDQLETVEAEM